ncbi:hypothetical protein Z042_02050 [Chania multitudinisentens RB-25]|uniref:Uncharacterized protein n=1 Tax=Chania multitudinisentens RB-25 TaxID=1441930 RepID=W0LFU3_9GAMM|nr:hypothetical protein [Chania multitudinisentens]AHG22596.1 hypothetical protein Z042_02050 [Chania multitudinisentens RB-25]
MLVWLQRVILCLCLLLSSANVLAADWLLGYRSSFARSSADNNLFFEDHDQNAYWSVLDLSVEHLGWRAAATTGRRWESQGTKNEFILTEAYVDDSFWGWDFTLGKKRLDWGVGYSYRPLDIIKSYDRQPIGVQIEEGAWIASVEHYTDTGSWTVLLSDSQSQQDDGSPRYQGGGIKYYVLLNGWDLQGVTYWDDKRKLSVGGSSVTVLGEASSIHFSALWQGEYTQLNHGVNGENYLANGAPVWTDTGKNALQWLSGINYNFQNKISLLTEYWYDGRSPSHSQWRKLIAAGEKQQATGDLYGLLSAERSFFTTQNLVRHNLLLHVRYEGEQWQPSADLTIAPEDIGAIATVRARYQWADGHWGELGGRWYGSKRGSVFNHLPDDKVIFFMLEGTF